MQPGYYRLTVTFFEKFGGEYLKVSWRGRNLVGAQDFNKHEIPTESLFYEIPPAQPIAPTLPPGPLNPADYPTGTFYEEFFGHYHELPDFDQLGGLRITGIEPVFQIDSMTSNRDYLRRYLSIIQIDQAGSYRFFTESSDGSQLHIGDQLAVDNDGTHGVEEQGSLPFELSPGYYPVTVTYFQHSGGDDVLNVKYEGPGLAKQDIPSDKIYHPAQPADPAPNALDPSDTATTDAVRFLTHASFGANKASINAVKSLGYEAWIDQQMDPVQTPISSHLPYAYSQDGRVDRWWFVALKGDDQLRQRVAFALSEIFVISERDANLADKPDALASYYDMLVQNAFGNYRDLIEDVSLHPAMGIYLSHIRNQKPDPINNIETDQNYGREVNQLFSLGLWSLGLTGRQVLDADRNPIPAYTQEHVVGFSHVFTGWNYGDDQSCDFTSSTENLDVTIPMQACENFHDTDPKLVHDHVNNPPGFCDPQFTDGCYLPGGRTAAEDLADALDNLASHPNTAPFMSTMLIKRLTTSNPTPGYVFRVARVWNQTNGDLGEVVKAILLDREAQNRSFARYPFYGKVREPIVAFTALYRALDLFVHDEEPSDGEPAAYFRFERNNEESQDVMLGQAPMRAPSVFNFFQPDHQHPGISADFGLTAPELQIVTDSTVVSYANALYDRVTDISHSNLDLREELALLESDPNVLIDHLNALLVAGQMSGDLEISLMDVFDNENRSRLERIQHALYLIGSAPEFMNQR